MKIQYIEIVTPAVDKVCEAYALLYDIQFGENDPILGGAH